MYSYMMALQKRIQDYLCAKTTLVSGYTANTDPAILSVADAHYFNVVFAMRNYPEALLQDATTKKIHKVVISEVDEDNNLITLTEPIAFDVAANSKLQRAPAYSTVKNVLLGDPEVIPDYPSICVVPGSEKVQWAILQGTDETQNLDIIVHVREDNQSSSTKALVRTAQDVADLLNADLHIKLDNRDRTGYNRPYNSLVTDITFAYSYKGEFIKSAKMSWFGTELWIRDFVTGNPSGSETVFD